MAKLESTLTRHDLEAKTVKRCWEDEAFRQEFTADPSATFARYLQVPATGIPKIIVHQEEPGSWHIVLPARPANASELTDADLEAVAGGRTIPVTVNVTVGVVLSATVTMAASLVVEGAKGGW